MKLNVPTALKPTDLPDEVRPKKQERTGIPNQKAKELLERLDKRGIVLKRAMETGTNPFDFQGPAYMRIAMDMLLAGGFKRLEYSDRLMAELNWSETSALGHTAIAISALVNTGAAIYEDGVIKPNVG